MLSCRDVTNNSSEYLDGNLPLLKRMSFRMHLYMCERCQRYIHQLEITIQALKGTREEEPVSEQKTQEIVALLKKHNEKQEP